LLFCGLVRVIFFNIIRDNKDYDIYDMGDNITIVRTNKWYQLYCKETHRSI